MALVATLCAALFPAQASAYNDFTNDMMWDIPTNAVSGVDGSDTTHIAWVVGTAPTQQLYYTRIDANGVRGVGGSAAVALSEMGTVGNVSMAVSSAGKAYVVYEFDDGSGEYTIKYRDVSIAGDVAPVINDLSTPGSNASFPAVAVDGLGNAHAAWAWFDGADNVAHYASIDSSGNIGAPVLLSGPTEQASQVQIAADADGNAFVVWRSSAGGTYSIYEATVFAAGGANTETLAGPTAGVSTPRVAVNPSGTAFVVWSLESAGDFILQLAPITTLTTVGATVDLETDPGALTVDAVAAQSTDNFMVAWRREVGGIDVLRAMKVLEDTTPGTVLDMSDGTVSATAVSTSMGGSDNFFLAWLQQSGGNDGMWSALVDQGGVATDPQLFAPATDDVALPSIVGDSTGWAAAVWRFDSSPFPALRWARGAGVPVASPSSVNFGSRSVDAGRSAATTVTITNTGLFPTGAMTAAIGEVAITVLDPGDKTSFKLVSTTCATSMQSAHTCNVKVAFDPVSTGTKSSFLAVTTTGGGGTLYVTLTGKGISGCPNGNSAGVTCTPRASGCGYTIVGTGYRDTIVGSSCADIIKGKDRGDTIYAYPGADMVYGGSGADTIHGGAAADTVHGGPGADTVYGGAGGDVLYGEEDLDGLDGGDGDDRLHGGLGPDLFLRGGAGNDWLWWEPDAEAIRG